MGRRHVDLRRAEILAAAASVAARQGFARTRVADVAAELGISTSLVFYHFSTKEVLLAAAFELATERELELLDEAVAGPGGPVARLRAVLGVMLPGMESPLGRVPEVDAFVDGNHAAEIEEAWRHLVDRWRAGLREVIRDGLASGDFRCPDPDDAGLRIVVLRDGLAMATQVRAIMSVHRAARWLAEYTASLLDIPVERLIAGREVPVQQAKWPQPEPQPSAPA